jgi:hypothetical protein
MQLAACPLALHLLDVASGEPILGTGLGMAKQ